MVALAVARGIADDHVPTVKVAGREQLVFDWSRQACAPDHFPDLPARALRVRRKTVQLLLSHSVNRRMVGSDLDRLRPRCRPVLSSRLDPDPASYDDKQWLASAYTADGRSVYALVHDEYQGHLHSGRCPQRRFRPCWYNAVTLARSADAGASYRHARPPRHLVASAPYRYRPGAGPFGLFSPSNIVRGRRDGYYYAFVLALPYRAQRRGSCLIRSRDLADPRSWRAWDGKAFDIRFVDPYLQRPANPGSHTCAPVAHENIQEMVQSLTYNTYLDRYVLVGQAGAYDRMRKRTVWGVYFATSEDLLHWSRRELIMEAELPHTWRCGDHEPIAHPSLLDPSSGSRNFETTGKRPYLYFTRLNYRTCRQTNDRDLVRLPMELSKR